jgi:hypothetical protein
MGGDDAALTHPPATQDSAGIIHNSRRCNQQFGKESWPSTNIQGTAGGPRNICGSAIEHVEPSRKTSGARENEYGSAEGPRKICGSAGDHLELLCEVSSTRTY